MMSVFLFQSDAALWDVVPHDPASLFIYVLLLVSGVVIWRASRNKGG